MSITIAPSASEPAAPLSPSSTASTSGESTTIVITASAPAAACDGVSASFAPVACATASALSRVRFHTVRSNPARDTFAAIREPMIPMPRKATFFISCIRGRLALAVSAAARRLDSQPVAGLQRARRLRRQLVAVQQVAAGLSRRAAGGARRRMAAALGDQREAHLVERLELTLDAIPAAELAGAARPAPDRVLDGAQRELQLQRLDRRVQCVAHR